MNWNMDPLEKMVSAASYLWVLFFLPLLLLPDSGFGRFHANQALVNLLWGILCFVLMRLLPGVGWLFGLLMGAYPFWGIITAMLGMEKPFPLIGRITILR